MTSEVLPSKIPPIGATTAKHSIVASMLTALARRVRLLIAAREHRHQLLRVAQSDDHLLADIGVTRQDIDTALSAPFWRDPTRELAHRLTEPKSDRQRPRGREVAHGNGQVVMTSPEMILAACNRRRLPLAPIYFAGR
jgi:uncharacterized protein YjiS (DUF1127 family)